MYIKFVCMQIYMYVYAYISIFTRISIIISEYRLSFLQWNSKFVKSYFYTTKAKYHNNYQLSSNERKEWINELTIKYIPSWKFIFMDLACPICRYPLGSGGNLVRTLPPITNSNEYVIMISMKSITRKCIFSYKMTYLFFSNVLPSIQVCWSWMGSPLHEVHLLHLRQ